MAVKEMDVRLAVSRFRGRLRSEDVFAHGLLGNGRSRETDSNRGECQCEDGSFHSSVLSVVNSAGFG